MTVRSEAEALRPTDAFAALYAQVQQFYAHQMQLLDAGEAERWAATFTEDARFDVPTLPKPVHGRPGLVTAAQRSADALAEAGERHRHFIGMLDLTERPDGVLDVRAYTIVYASRIGGGCRVHRVCVCTDVLVRSGDELRVRTRTVTRDDFP
ncbi:nuclear transport factor 2 family protein [Streptomyces sp. NPDC029004]|uniref:nuclear transport factor 2 family protein n=1 Tax=Streptomyces sp. NPDC029004 TaxID=3154490 RepID=UPI0033DB4A89